MRKRTTSAAVRFSFGPSSCGVDAALDDDLALGDRGLRRGVGRHVHRLQLFADRDDDGPCGRGGRRPAGPPGRPGTATGTDHRGRRTAGAPTPAPGTRRAGTAHGRAAGTGRATGAGAGRTGADRGTGRGHRGRAAAGSACPTPTRAGRGRRDGLARRSDIGRRAGRARRARQGRRGTGSGRRRPPGAGRGPVGPACGAGSGPGGRRPAPAAPGGRARPAGCRTGRAGGAAAGRSATAGSSWRGGCSPTARADGRAGRRGRGGRALGRAGSAGRAAGARGGGRSRRRRRRAPGRRLGGLGRGAGAGARPGSGAFSSGGPGRLGLLGRASWPGSSGCSSRTRPSRWALRRTRSAWASSMLDEWVFTPMPRPSQRSRASLLVSPSSFASSWTRIFAAKCLLHAFRGLIVRISGDVDRAGARCTSLAHPPGATRPQLLVSAWPPDPVARAVMASGRTGPRSARGNAPRFRASSTHAGEPAHSHAPRPGSVRPTASEPSGPAHHPHQFGRRCGAPAADAGADRRPHAGASVSSASVGSSAGSSPRARRRPASSASAIGLGAGGTSGSALDVHRPAPRPRARTRPRRTRRPPASAVAVVDRRRRRPRPRRRRARRRRRPRSPVASAPLLGRHGLAAVGRLPDLLAGPGSMTHSPWAHSSLL